MMELNGVDDASFGIAMAISILCCLKFHPPMNLMQIALVCNTHAAMTFSSL